MKCVQSGVHSPKSGDGIVLDDSAHSDSTANIIPAIHELPPTRQAPLDVPSAPMLIPGGHTGPPKRLQFPCQKLPTIPCSRDLKPSVLYRKAISNAVWSDESGA